jgi:hypothetical protein
MFLSLLLLLAGMLMPPQHRCYCSRSCCSYSYYLLAAPATNPAAAALVPIFSDFASCPDTVSLAVFNVPATTVSAVMASASVCALSFFRFLIYRLSQLPFFVSIGSASHSWHNNCY